MAEFDVEQLPYFYSPHGANVQIKAVMSHFMKRGGGGGDDPTLSGMT